MLRNAGAKPRYGQRPRGGDELAREVVEHSGLILIHCKRGSTNYALLETYPSGVIVKFGNARPGDASTFSAIPTMTRLYRYDECPACQGIHDEVGWHVSVLHRFKDFLEQEDNHQ